jgi:hypothetical protein
MDISRKYMQLALLSKDLNKVTINHTDDLSSSASKNIKHVETISLVTILTEVFKNDQSAPYCAEWNRQALTVAFAVDLGKYFRLRNATVSCL